MQGLLKQTVGWTRWKKWGVSLLAATAVVPLVYMLVYQAYKKEFLTEMLRINFDIPHPNQTDGDRLDINFLIHNKGSSPILIEKISAIKIETTDLSNNPWRNAELCKQNGVYRPYESMMTWLHPEGKVSHTLMDKPSFPPAPSKYGSEGGLPFPDDKKLNIANYDTSALSEGGKDVVGAISIDAGKAVSFAASFDTDPTTWNTHNVMIICGPIKYVRSDGEETWAVCPAWTAAHLYQGAMATGLASGGSPKGFTIDSTGSKESACGSRGL
jgi:hypothetical protein